MQKKYIIFFLIFLSLKTVGQDPFSSVQAPLFSAARTDTATFPRYRILNFGIGRQTLRDPLLSTLRYSGPSFSVQLNTLKYKPKLLTNSVLSLHFNNLGNQSTGAVIMEFGGDYSYSVYKKIKKVGNANRAVFIGGIGEAVFNFRYAKYNVNNLFSYDGVLSVGATGLVQQHFKLFNREFMISEQLDLPLFSLLSRPPYAWSYPAFLEETGKFTDALQVGSWNKYFKIRNKLMLDFYSNIKHKKKKIGKNAWRITYQWEYFSIPYPNKVQSGTQLFMFGKIIKF